MKSKGLFYLVTLILLGVGTAHAQTDVDQSIKVNSPGFDGRWYIAPTLGGYYNAKKRNTNRRQLYYGLALGKFWSPDISLDIFADRTKRNNDTGGNWFNNNLGASGRYYFGKWDDWRPYLVAGILGSYHHNVNDQGWGPATEFGAGISKTLTVNTGFRIEAGYRYDWDDKSRAHSNSDLAINGYGDWFLGFSIISRFGMSHAPASSAAISSTSLNCSAKDSDGDGVNDCHDKCPATPAGTIVGPNGCPQKVIIDLRGVNFKFDRPKVGETDIAKTLAKPTANSLAILDQAVDTLKRYPQAHVTVAGYTDNVGTAAYNRALSERRAKIVYDYLVSHGVAARRLEGPLGYGENNPLDSNATVVGRHHNRRTELQVQP